MERKKYNKEFKLESIALADKIGAYQASRDLGIANSSIYKWRKALALKGASAFPGNGRLSPEDEELRRLKRENAILQNERDILKKAIAFFAKANR